MNLVNRHWRSQHATVVQHLRPRVWDSVWISSKFPHLVSLSLEEFSIRSPPLSVFAVAPVTTPPDNLPLLPLTPSCWPLAGMPLYNSVPYPPTGCPLLPPFLRWTDAFLSAFTARLTLPKDDIIMTYSPAVFPCFVPFQAAQGHGFVDCLPA